MKRIMLLSLALSAVAAAQPNCGPESVRGTYLVTTSGWTVSPPPGGQTPVPTPAMVMAVASVGSDGKITMAGTVNFAGQQAEFEAEGSFDIKPDCTGSARARVRPVGGTQWFQQTFRIVVLPEEKEICQFHTTPGDMGMGAWKRMLPVPNAAKW